MSTPVLKRTRRVPLSPRRLPGPGPAEWALAAALLVWGLVLVAWKHLPADRLPVTLPDRVGQLVELGLPALLVLVAVLGRRVGPAQRDWAIWFAAAAVGIAVVPRVEAQLVVLLAVPALVVLGVVARTRPWIVVGGVVALVSFGRTIQAYTGLDPARPVQLLLVAFAVMVAVHWLTGRSRAVRLTPGAALLGVYVAVTFLMAVTVEDRSIAIRAFTTGAGYMAVALVLAYAPLDRDRLRSVVRVIVVIAVAVGAYAMYHWAVGPSAQEVALRDGTASVGYEFVGGERRVGGSFLSAFALGGWCVVMLAFGTAIVLAVGSRLRVVAGVAVALTALALTATEARSSIGGAALSAVVVLVVFLAVRSVSGGRKVAPAALVASVMVVGVVAFVATQTGQDTAQSERIERIVRPSTDGSYLERRSKWSQAARDLEGQPLGFGLGSSGGLSERFGRFTTISTENLDSSYLKIAYEQGWAILVLFAAALMALVVDLVRAAVRAPTRLQAAVATGAAGALVGYSVPAGFGYYFEGLRSLPIWIVVGLGLHVAATRTAPGASPEPETEEPAPPPPEPVRAAPRPRPAVAASSPWLDAGGSA